MTLLLPPNGSTPRDISRAVNAALTGKVNCFGSVTLVHGAASTTVTNQFVGTNSIILLMPQTAHAAAELQNGTIYIKPGDYVVGTSFKITHANDANTDKTFGYVILG